jgi:hypothetical protein
LILTSKTLEAVKESANFSVTTYCPLGTVA